MRAHLAFLLAAAPLWTGSPYTQADRDKAVRRGLHFIYSIAQNPTYFAEYGHDLLWCLYSISVTSADPGLRQMAASMGRERAREWRLVNPSLPPGADANEVATLAFGSDVADRLGARDSLLKQQLRLAAARFTAVDFLLFDPAHEPPPANVPDACSQCGADNVRGAQKCHKCGAALTMRSRYDVWYDALITTYTGDRYGVTLGAPYSEVIQWLPSMRPYCERRGDPDFYDTVYAITHVVYTLNDYSVFRLRPDCLRPEFEFLKANLHEAAVMKDPETMGEFLDTLRSFGLTTADPEVRMGVEFILSTQNADGSWGDPKDPEVYNRYHATWTAVDGLREYRFQRARPCRLLPD
jgi:hypothetical protein